MTNHVLSPARHEDARDIARLYRIASDGVSDYVWSKQARPGQHILDVGQARYEREETSFSYQNCTVARTNNEVAGLLMTFPQQADPSSEPDPILRPYSLLEENDSYYIAGVALFPEYRCQGIGSQFMALAEEKAHKIGLHKTSLIVFSANLGGKQLYDRLGYEERARETIIPHPLIRSSGEAILMVKNL